MAMKSNNRERASVETVIGEGSTLEGTIVCEKDVVVAGRVEGNLKCEGEIRLESSAIFVGDVYANVMVMEEGAVLTGLIGVGEDTKASEVEDGMRRAANA